MRALFLLMIGCAMPASQTTLRRADIALADDADPRAIDEFRWVLEPYGNWIEDGEWGTIWVPAYVRKGFTPYATDGHWNGKEWKSDYPWGWVTFHYGPLTRACQPCLPTVSLPPHVLTNCFSDTARRASTGRCGAAFRAGSRSRRADRGGLPSASSPARERRARGS